MSDAFIAVLAVTDLVMCIGFFVMGKIIEELEDRVKTCEHYNKLDEKDIMELRGRCRTIEDRYQGIVDALQEKKENNNG